MASVVERIDVEVEGQSITVERLDDGTFRKPRYLAGAEREVVGKYVAPRKAEAGSAEDEWPNCDGVSAPGTFTNGSPALSKTITAPATPLAARWDGWKSGIQALKPAAEVVVIAQKPMPKSFATPDVREKLGPDWGPYLYARQELSESKEPGTKPNKKLRETLAHYGIKPFGDEKRRWILYETRTSIVPEVQSDRKLHHADGAIVIWERPYHDTLAANSWLNVVMWGTGALNTKGAAVPWAGDAMTQEQWNQKGAGGAPGANGYAGQFSADMKQAYADGKIPVPAGRHPANVVSTGGALGARSKYFDADSFMRQRFPNWWAQEPVTWTEESATVYCLKASRGEKERGLEGAKLERRLIGQTANNLRCSKCGRKAGTNAEREKCSRCGSEELEQYRTPAPVRHNPHPTLKPLALLCWLATLGCPVGGTILDPFAGSGSSGVAARMLGLRWLGMEMQQTDDEPYCEISKRRIMAAEYEEPESRQLTLEEVAG